MTAKDDMELIKMIVDHLPPLQQQIFRLKDIDGYENEEIAKNMWLLARSSPSELVKGTATHSERVYKTD